MGGTEGGREEGRRGGRDGREGRVVGDGEGGTEGRMTVIHVLKGMFNSNDTTIFI